MAGACSGCCYQSKLLFEIMGKSNNQNFQAIAPGVPKWVLEDGGEIGIISNHVYFGEQPWKITCAANEVQNYS